MEDDLMNLEELTEHARLLAYGPNHPGTIQGLTDKDWAQFGKQVTDDLRLIYLSLLKISGK